MNRDSLHNVMYNLHRPLRYCSCNYFPSLQQLFTKERRPQPFFKTILYISSTIYTSSLEPCIYFPRKKFLKNSRKTAKKKATKSQRRIFTFSSDESKNILSSSSKAGARFLNLSAVPLFISLSAISLNWKDGGPRIVRLAQKSQSPPRSPSSINELWRIAPAPFHRLMQRLRDCSKEAEAAGRKRHCNATRCKVHGFIFWLLALPLSGRVSKVFSLSLSLSVLSARKCVSRAKGARAINRIVFLSRVKGRRRDKIRISFNPLSFLASSLSTLLSLSLHWKFSARYSPGDASATAAVALARGPE